MFNVAKTTNNDQQRLFSLKCIFALFFLVVGSTVARAGALGSVYNGQQYDLKGQLLVQSADKPSEFYYLPKTYQLIVNSVFDANGNIHTTYMMKNQVVNEHGKKYSVYLMNFTLDKPSEYQLAFATEALRRSFGETATIKGMAPICGIDLEMNGKPVSLDDTPQNATVIRYSISSTELGKCDSVVDPSNFSVELRVPIQDEPQWANGFTSDVGEFLPAVKFVLPYKYKNEATMTINAADVYNSIKDGAGFEGTYKEVSLAARDNIEKAYNTLQAIGSIRLDCQDPGSCNEFRDTAIKILEDTFIKYTALNTATSDTNPLIVADQNRANESGKFKLEMAIDQQTAIHRGSYTVNFSDTAYSEIQTEAQVKVSGLPVRLIDPQIRKLMGGQ